MEDKTIFLQRVTELFLLHGAKVLTMDDIAKEFGISKKTLYQKYRNKEALLEEVLEYKLNILEENLSHAQKASSNAIESMMRRDRVLESELACNKTIFIRQLIKYYPAIFSKHTANFSQKLVSFLLEATERGRKEDIFRKDFDAKIYATLFFQMLISYDSSPLFDQAAVNREIYITNAVMLYLNAICNENGKQILKNKEQL